MITGARPTGRAPVPFCCCIPFVHARTFLWPRSAHFFTGQKTVPSNHSSDGDRRCEMQVLAGTRTIRPAPQVHPFEGPGPRSLAPCELLRMVGTGLVLRHPVPALFRPPRSERGSSRPGSTLRRTPLQYLRLRGKPAGRTSSYRSRAALRRWEPLYAVPVCGRAPLTHATRQNERNSRCLAHRNAPVLHHSGSCARGSPAAGTPRGRLSPYFTPPQWR